MYWMILIYIYNFRIDQHVKVLKITINEMNIKVMSPDR